MTDHKKLIERLKAVIDTAVSDSATVDSQMSVTAEDHAAGERDRGEAEAVRDAVVSALEAPEPPRSALDIARNIINQIGDLWSERIPSDEWAPVRQSTNDELDQFAARLIAGHKPQTEPSGAAILAADDVMLGFRSGTQYDMIRAMLLAAATADRKEHL